MPTKRPLAKETASFRHSFLYFIPALLWVGLITVLTLTPSHTIPQGLQGLNDKIIHAGIYFITCGLIYLGFIRFNFKYPVARKILGGIVLLCIFYGGIIELLQHYLTTSRSGDWLDFLANSAGVIVSALLLRMLHRLNS